jgi:hypothetical protein
LPRRLRQRFLPEARNDHSNIADDRFCVIGSELIGIPISEELMEQAITVGMVIWASAAVIGCIAAIGIILFILAAIADGYKH